VPDWQDRGAGERQRPGPIALDGPGPVTPSTPKDASIPLFASFLADGLAERWAGGDPLQADALVSGMVNRSSPRYVPADVWRRVEPTVRRLG
jgi:hypothetical protein